MGNQTVQDTAYMVGPDALPEIKKLITFAYNCGEISQYDRGNYLSIDITLKRQITEQRIASSGCDFSWKEVVRLTEEWIAKIEKTGRNFNIDKELLAKIVVDFNNGEVQVYEMWPVQEFEGKLWLKGIGKCYKGNDGSQILFQAINQLMKQDS